jgi:hypothetical protein
MPPRKKSNTVSAPSTRKTRSSTAVAAREHAAASLSTKDVVSDVAGTDRGAPIEALIEGEGGGTGSGDELDTCDQSSE